MSENRFEQILRAFTLPTYSYTDEEWGGEARDFYEQKKYDKCWETRKFTDMMKKKFQDACKPGGWLCIDESMFSWLGRVLGMPGWKVIKRKPHPFGLEAKVLACSLTGMVINFEFQEGKDPMGHFSYIEETNRSTAWALRLTRPWHNKEKRTVIADAAFGQVRAAVALKRIAGLFFIGNVKTCNKHFPQKELREQCGEYVRDRLVCLSKRAKIGSNEDMVEVYATGWRATGKMVVTYVHTGGTTVTGSDRVKRKYSQLNNGDVRQESYHVKRPKVSSEYQQQMGAVDAHNFRRQSGRSTAPLEKVCVTRRGKDRVFINIVGWILVNIYLAKKYFIWGGEEKKSASEVQEAIAMALINNQFLNENLNSPEDVTANVRTVNDPENLVRHPMGKLNLCRQCFRRRSIWICEKCSRPETPRQRRELGPKGGEKTTHSGYMHFCKKGCYGQHDCGHVRRRRTKATMQVMRGQI